MISGSKKNMIVFDQNDDLIVELEHENQEQDESDDCEPSARIEHKDVDGSLVLNIDSELIVSQQVANL